MVARYGWGATATAAKEQTNNLVYDLYGHGGGGTKTPMTEVFVGGAYREAKAPSALALNTWTHLASTYDGTTLRLYVNGTQVATLAIAGTITTSTGALRIGGNSIWNEWFEGMIDEVRIYNRALSAGEIQADLATSVREDLARLHASPYFPPAYEVIGFVYDVRTGRLQSVEEPPT